MNGVKTIDVRGLGLGEKQKMIFPQIDALQEGETARIIVEFNPLPLVALMRVRRGFSVVYEKEGPDEWIVRISRIAPKKNNTNE
jgi:uncharacterized protein (DUF2249 family)